MYFVCPRDSTISRTHVKMEVKKGCKISFPFYTRLGVLYLNQRETDREKYKETESGEEEREKRGRGDKRRGTS